MREEGRISLGQFAILLVAYLIGRSTLIMPVGPAKQDGWLGILLGGLLATGPLFLWLTLGLRFQGLSPVTYLRTVLGDFLGIPVVVLYLWFWLHLGAGVVRNMGEMYVTAIMPETPIVVFTGMLAALAASSVRGGIEVIARLAEILTPLIILSVLGLTILTLATPGLAHWEYLQPFLGSGWPNILRAVFLTYTFPFGEAMVFTFLLPFVTEPRSVRPYTLGPFAFIALLLALTHTRNLVVLGPYEIAHVTLPSLTTVQLINLGEFLQRLDPFIVFTWTFGGFLKVAVLLYITCLGSAELLGLRDYRPLVFPLALLMTSLSILIYENFAQMESIYRTIYPFYALPFNTVIPATTLLVALIRRKRIQTESGKARQKSPGKTRT